MTRWFLALVAAVAVLGALPAAATAGTVPPGGATTTTAVENVFIPADVDLSDCISGVQRPGCGSAAKGGWRQGLVFGALVAGLAFIAWQIVRAARRGRPDLAPADAPDDGDRAPR